MPAIASIMSLTYKFFKSLAVPPHPIPSASHGTSIPPYTNFIESFFIIEIKKGALQSINDKQKHVLFWMLCNK